MPGPEIIGFNLESFEQRSSQGRIGDVARAPLFQLRREVVVQRPARGEGDAALGVVGGPRAVEVPESAWQDAVGEFVALTPPLVPDAPDILVGPVLRSA